MELIQNEFFVAEKFPVRPKRSKVEILTARAAKLAYFSIDELKYLLETKAFSPSETTVTEEEYLSIAPLIKLISGRISVSYNQELGLDRYMGSTYSRQLINVIPRKCSDPNTPILVQEYVDDPVSAHIYIGLENSASEDGSNTVIDISKEYLEHVLCGRDMLPKEYVDFLTTFQQHTVTVCPGEEYFLIDAANETEE